MDMKAAYTLFLASAAALGGEPARDGPSQVPSRLRSAASARLLDFAERRADALPAPEAASALFEVAARAILEFDPELWPEERASLETALAKGGSATEAARELRLSIRKDHEFRLLEEAPLPAGFPGPGPVGVVVEKLYPAYRAARAEGGMFAFGRLFSHIQSNGIEMTAPVLMTMEAKGARGMEMADMAFLYATPALGRPGADGSVEVVDAEPVRVVSCGMRGAPTAARIDFVRERIEKRLRRDGLEPAGPWRLLGYNSPMVEDARRFHELQVPVREARRP